MDVGQSQGILPPSWLDPITSALETVRSQLLEDRSGEVASYIPELSRADPEPFGLALASLGGNLYRAGEADHAFSIQSMSKPFVLALAVADRGWDGVRAKVGVEPSGEAFDATTLEPGTGRPPNPLVNAGAIVTTSLVEASSTTERIERVLEVLSAFAGRRLEVDHEVLASELEHAERNRALGWLLKGAGVLEAEVEDALLAYITQCATLVTAADVAIMAATLANGGTNPVTGVEVVDRTCAARVLAVMTTCGMYDASGAWMLEVGLPAKSGVAGGIVVVSPGQFGLGLFSPRLDPAGNSVRAKRAAKGIAERFGLHLLLAPVSGSRSLHRTGWATSVPGVTLDPELGGVVAVRSLRGDVEFVEAEPLLSELSDRVLTLGAKALVLDLVEVTSVHPVAAQMLALTLAHLADEGVVVVLVDPERHLAMEQLPCSDTVLGGIDLAAAALS